MSDRGEALLAGLTDDIAREIEGHDAFDCPDDYTYVKAAREIAERLVERFGQVQFATPNPCPASPADDDADYHRPGASGYSRADEEWFFDMDGKP